MPTKVPAYTYTYEVTGSDHPNVAVGTHLVDKGRELHKTWETINLDTGTTHWFTGKRGERICSECRTLYRLVRQYGHDGDHGQSAPLLATPTAPPAPRPEGE